MNENIEFLQAFLKNPDKSGLDRSELSGACTVMVEGVKPDQTMSLLNSASVPVRSQSS